MAFGNQEVTLQNEVLQVTVSSDGAEMQSIYHKKYNREYLWQGDDKIWGRKAPVLFPIVGRLENDSYSLNGETYSMTQHGFARDMEHELKQERASRCVFELTHNEETLEKYPFKFLLRTTYQLDGKKVVVTHEVFNKGDEIMYFSLGGHPGLNVPFVDGTKFEDYQLEWDKDEHFQRLLLTENGLRSGEVQDDCFDEEQIVPLRYKDFENDAWVLDDFISNYVDLYPTELKEKKIRFHFADWEQIGVWTKPGANAPFLCLEPWAGVADQEGENVDFKEKYGVQTLMPRKSFKASYAIEIF